MIDKQAIGGMLMSMEVMEKCVQMGVKAEMLEWGHEIFNAAMTVFASGKEVNAISLYPYVKDRGALLDAQGEYIGETASIMALKQIKNRGDITKLKRSVAEANRLVESWNGKDEPIELASKIMDFFTGEIVHEAVDPMDTAVKLIDYWESTPEHERAGIQWFMPVLQNKIGSLTKQLVYLEAKRSVGKSAFMFNMMAYCAQRDIKTSCVSIESMDDDVGGRMITVVTGINSMALRRNTIYPSAYEEARQKIKAFRKQNIGWNFNTRTSESILAWAKSEVRKGSQAIFIDNMRHVKPATGRSKTEEFGNISLDMKKIRDTCGVPVIVLHHLNQDGKTAWSTDIENDADIVLKLLNAREVDGELVEIEDDGRPVMDVVLNCTKNREGRCGSVALEFIKDKQMFKEKSDDDYDHSEG
jgi:replicative DNA helicase